MQKCLIFLLALISFSVQARANWTPHKMDLERFMSLEEKDKDTLIIRRMEIMIELESKYAREVTVSGYSFERFQKYVQILNQLQSLIINDAMAADPVSFSTLVDKPGGCIYGGWASEIKIVNKTPLCVHPLKAKNPAIVAAYKATKNTCAENEISCNPMVFGFKKSDSKSPFCISTGFASPTVNKAHNVSYECMRSALKVDAKNQDSKQVRLDAMKNAIAKDPVAFNDVQKYIFKTCACGKGNMDQSYKSYIRPHRTCFGMMNSLKNFYNKECSDLATSLAKDHGDFAVKWNEFFSDNNIKELKVPPSKEPQEFDKEYNKLISDPLVAKYCEELDVIPIEVKKEWVCETTCETKENKTSCTINKAGFKSLKDGVEVFEIAETLSNKIEDTKPPSALVKMKDTKIVDQSCPVFVEPKVEVKKPSCSISFSKDKDQSKATVAFENLAPNTITEIHWKLGESQPKVGVDKEIIVGKDDKKVSIEFYFKDEKNIVGEKQACEGVVPEPDKVDEKKPTLSVKAEAAQPTSVKLNATVLLDGKPLTLPTGEGLHLSWFRTKDGGKTREKVAKPAETKPTESTAAKSEEEIKLAADAEAASTKEVVAEGEFSREISVTETRLENQYETCASLIDGTGKTVVEKICNPIPALEKPKQNITNPNNNNNRQIAPTQSPYVPTFNFRRKGMR
jgi:hypothetical protein